MIQFTAVTKLLYLSSQEMAPTGQRLKDILGAIMIIMWEEQLVDTPIAYITFICPEHVLNLGPNRIAVFEDCKVTALTTQLTCKGHKLESEPLYLYSCSCFSPPRFNLRCQTRASTQGVRGSLTSHQETMYLDCWDRTPRCCSSS